LNLRRQNLVAMRAGAWLNPLRGLSLLKSRGDSLELDALGFSTGESKISFSHQHHYREEFDADAQALLGVWDCSYSALLREDEQ